MSETPSAAATQERNSASSCEIKTSTRGTDIAVKVYAGSPIDDVCDTAVMAYFRTFDRVREELMGRT
jgi:hypothetical protein